MLLLSMSVSAPLSGSGAEELDAQLARIAQGDQEALAHLYNKTRAAVYGFALSLLKNVQDAEDVLQDTFVQVYLSAGQYRSHGKPMAWLITIARNLALSRLREHGKTVTMSPEDWQIQFADLAGSDQDDRLVLESLLQLLSDEERQIVVLHALTGLKHREIAALLELPLPTVLSKYNRALKKLKTAWKEAE